MFTGVMDGLGKIGGGLLDIPNLPIKIPGLEDRLLEERKSLPILGGMRKFERQASEMSVSSQLDANQSVDNYDNLPF